MERPLPAADARHEGPKARHPDPRQPLALPANHGRKGPNRLALRPHPKPGWARRNLDVGARPHRGSREDEADSRLAQATLINERTSAVLPAVRDRNALVTTLRGPAHRPRSSPPCQRGSRRRPLPWRTATQVSRSASSRAGSGSRRFAKSAAVTSSSVLPNNRSTRRNLTVNWLLVCAGRAARTPRAHNDIP